MYTVHESLIVRLKKYISEVTTQLAQKKKNFPLEIVLRYPEEKANFDEIRNFCHDRNFCIHKTDNVELKNSQFIINHIVKRVLREDTSSLDIERIDTDRIEIYRKIRADPFVKRLAIVSSGKTRKMLGKM